MISSPVASFTRLLKPRTSMTGSILFCMERLKVNWTTRATLALLVCTCATRSFAVDTTTNADAVAATAGKPSIVVLGDSISAEYGLPRDTGWVALLRRRLADKRIDYSVANASISGDTTSGGRARMPVLMARLKPSIVIVELGANDALRGVPLPTTEDNLRTIVAAAQQ